MKQIEILKEDFSQTVDFIDKCDDHIFKIKNWALLTSSAVIAFSISQDYRASELSIASGFYILGINLQVISGHGNSTHYRHIGAD